MPLKKPEDFKDWELLPQAAYQLILTEAKERFEECLSESESITNKSIKFIIAILGFFSAFIAAILCRHIPWLVTGGYLLISVIDIVFWAILIFPKPIIQRGTNPFLMFTSALNGTDFSDEEKIRSIYFQSCIRYEDNIRQMLLKNKGRICKYKAAIRLFLFSLSLILLIYLVYVFPL